MPTHPAAGRIRTPALALALAALALGGCGNGAKSGRFCSPAPVGTADPVQHFDAASWGGCDTLTVQVPSLGAGEQLALVLVNQGGPDNTVPTVAVSGTSATLPLVDAPLLASLHLDALLAPGLEAQAARAAAHDAVRRRSDDALSAWLAAGSPSAPAPASPRVDLAVAAPVVGDTRSFCVQRFNNSTSTITEQKTATLRHVSAHAYYYVVNDVQPGFDAAAAALGGSADTTIWAPLEADYETPATGILARLGQYFGTETDVDANGKMIFLFANLGQISSTGFPVGYFDSKDVIYAQDTTCNPAGALKASNGADILYLLDIGSFASHSYPYGTILDAEYPGTMAHELQHNVNFNVKCWAPVHAGQSCLVEDTWVNEGLSMVSEDLAGYGLATTSERSRLGQYFATYQGWSMTDWQSDAIGNYGGAHAFMRYWLDQRGSALTTALVTSRLVGNANVEAATGVAFEAALARFAGASIFSGETFAPTAPTAGEWQYATGVPWSPLHTSLGYVNYTALTPGLASSPTLRTDGWATLVTGTGSGGPATLTVTSGAAVKPTALLVRFSGSLPR
jgi:hypothetical protein